jgi:hypothetical protein
MQSTPFFFCLILIKFEFSPQIFEKCSNIKFNEILPEVAEFFHANGQTDGQDEANNRS